MKRIPPAAYALLVLLALFWGANWPVLDISLREAPVFGMATGIVFRSENPYLRDSMAKGLTVAALALMLLQPRTASEKFRRQETKKQETKTRN